ncbi:MAG: GH3 auxin-responsive promoter family protein, partial [Deltaproteobacteria bacterium]|nr:GH3 auxin-responsive promoter family protein [Deltaproteobacteria bacterium]
DLCGEKVSARQVEAGLAAAAVGARWSFALLAPELSPRPRYVLYLESEEGAEALRGVGAALEAHLATGHHYAYCRRLGQLGPLEVRRVRDGASRALAARLGWGQRLGDIKPSLLDRRAGVWGAALGASEPL